MLSTKLTIIIKYLLYALALTPLIVTPMTIFPFNFGRGLAVQFLIEIIFGLYLALAIFDKQYRPKKNPLIILLGLFLGVLFISSFFGVDFHKSFWSSEQRFTGWLYLLHIFLFFIVITSVFKSRKDWNSFLGLNVIVGVLMFAIAILGIFGIKFWGVDLGTRISGTIGNPIFLATYFILNFVFALYLFFDSRYKTPHLTPVVEEYFTTGQASPRVQGEEEEHRSSFSPLVIKGGVRGGIWLLLALILFCGIIFAQSTGAILGTISGIIIGLAYYGLFNKRKKARAAVLFGILSVIILISGLFIFKESDFVNKNQILNRISDISIASGTGSTRIINWQNAWSAIKERPILGWGMEGGKIALNKYYNPTLLKYSYYETWPDKPHNKVLEVGIDSGFVGIFIYLSIFLYSVFIIWKKRQKEKISLAVAATLTGGLAAYFIQNLFVFDTTVSYLLFFVFLGLMGEHENTRTREHENTRIPPCFLLVSLVVAIIAGWFVNISPLLASIKLRSTIPLLDIRQKADLGGYKKAMEYFNPYKEEWREDLFKNVISSLRREDNIYNSQEIEFALDEAEKYAIDHPNSAYSHMLLGIFYGELGVKDKKYFDLAKAELDIALELSPKRQHIYFAYGRLYGLMKDKKSLVDTFKKAIDLEPNAPLSYWEAGKQLYILDPQDLLFKEWLVKTADLGYAPEDKDEFLFLFKFTYRHLLDYNNYEAIYGFCKRMQTIEPNEAKWFAQGATASYLGRKDGTVFEDIKEEESSRRIIGQIKKAIELDESYREEGEAFIKMIKAGE
ncbi:O-antigen ligase family protein [Patescibacteria group bacterium]|nr:O-antigen ligase family protein [Patescibacteria group bacterium]